MTTVSMLLGNVSSGYVIKNSLRLRSSNSAYLSRTFGTPTSATTWTISWWAKLGAVIANGGNFFGSYTSSASNFSVRYNTPGAYGGTGCNIEIYNNGSVMDLMTANALRDPSAWYHFVMAVDTTQATASNRLKFYINGVQANFATYTTYPNQNSTVIWNTNGTTCLIGALNNPLTSYYDGYLAEVNFVDGTAPVASSFGTYDVNGVWQPINYSGSYGNNGFHLTFGNTTSTTTLGYDTSPNGNNWTTSGLSLTAGATYDSMTDSPTVTSASVANYATLNAAYTSAITLSNGNLNYSIPVAAPQQTIGTISVTSGKWYWEVVPTSGNQLTAIGVASVEAIGNGKSYVSSTSTNPVMAYECVSGQVWINGSIVTTITTSAANDTVAIAYDAGANTAAIYKNNTLLYTATLTGTARGAVAYLGNPSGAQAAVGYINFGQRAFTYTPPTGFNALNTYNLPTPTIANGALYMAATLYTGTGAQLNVTNGGNNTIGTTFQPDLVWLKARNYAFNNLLTDSVRGTGLGLVSNSTAAEASNGMTAFNSNGFQVQNNSETGGNGVIYVGWQWQANKGTNVTNTNGSITSTVSANTTAGFSVVTYTGTGANATIGHGLGVAPSMVITKSRSLAGSHWTVYHISLGNTGALLLDTTASTYTSSTYWNSTSPTSSVFSVGVDGSVNNSGSTFVAYCWAAVAGYSAFGSYTGNGNTDGPFVYTGFRPRWLLIKNSSTGNGWGILDTSRPSYPAINVESYILAPNAADAETSYLQWQVDILSNGFKLRYSSAESNGSGNTLIYAAFAENPFQSSRAR
jgi:hypothetical protein